MALTIEQALQRGVTAHNEGRLQEAESFYRTILYSEPEHPDANHNLGVIAVSVNNTKAALPFFKMAIEANPRIGQFWVSYISALIKEQQLDNAKQALQRAKTQIEDLSRLDSLEAQLLNFTQKSNAVGLSPPQELLNTLVDHYQSGRFEEAEKLSLKITKNFPRHPFPWRILGAVMAQAGRNFEAEAANRTAVTLSPQNAEAHNNLGNTLKALGRLDEAKTSYSQAIALKPELAEAHNNLGLTLQELGLLNEAEACLIKAIALKPDYGIAYSNLGLALQELGRLSDAEANLAKAIELQPDYAQAHSNLAVTLQKLGRLDKAEASYNHAIALKPDLADALYNRSLLLFKKAEYEIALRDADACVLKKSRAHSLACLYALGRIDEIYERIEIYSKEDGEDISIASFAAFISVIERRPIAYNFCPKPLDFIYVANLASHVSEPFLYTDELIEELNKVETVWEPFGQSTVKGFHSPKTFNLFENPPEKIAKLKSIIFSEIERYCQKFENSQCTYINKFPTTRHLFGWTITLKKQGHQDKHIHPSGWLSGVIYLKVVPCLGKNEGAIEFTLNGENYSDPASPKLVHQPGIGDIVLFPSSLAHGTIPFTSDVDRTIISFDLIPNA